MSYYSSAVTDIIDAHVHMGSVEQASALLAICSYAGIQSTALVSIQDPAHGSGLAQSLYMKARHPGLKIIFGTDVSSRMTVEEGSSRAAIIYRWLESADTFRVPGSVDSLLGPPIGRYPAALYLL